MVTTVTTKISQLYSICVKTFIHKIMSLFGLQTEILQIVYCFNCAFIICNFSQLFVLNHQLEKLSVSHCANSNNLMDFKYSKVVNVKVLKKCEVSDFLLEKNLGKITDRVLYFCIFGFSIIFSSKTVPILIFKVEYLENGLADFNKFVLILQDFDEILQIKSTCSALQFSFNVLIGEIFKFRLVWAVKRRLHCNSQIAEERVSELE